MRAQINAITIAAKDLLKLKAFYANIFGWEIYSENLDMVIFRLKNGLMLSIYKDADHAQYLGTYAADSDTPKFYLTINTNSLRETDELFAKLRTQGVNIVRQPAKVFWGGYVGIITDPENNYWEICFNPILHLS